MSKSQQTGVRFSCHRCFQRFRAPATKAGSRWRCPRCQLVMKIPAETQKIRTGEEYAVSDAIETPASEEKPYIALTCLVCRTRMHAAPDQVGQQIVCPDCRTPAVVRQGVEAEKRKRAWSAPVEEYSISEEEDGSLAGIRPAGGDEALIPVHCLLCDTLMYAVRSQVGQQITCPDCETSTVVAPPSQTGAKSASTGFRPGEHGQYEVREDQGLPAAGSVADGTYVPAVCPVCRSRLHTTPDQVGRQITCPDCRVPFVVPPAPGPRKRPQSAATTEEPYQLAAPSGNAKLPRPAGLFSAPRRSGDRALIRLPPPLALMRGVLGFPFYSNSLPRWATLSATLAGALSLGVFMVDALVWAGVNDRGMAIMLGPPGVIFALMWIGAAASALLAILIDTAYGYDQVENWPGLAMLDRIGDSLFVIHSLILCAAAGLGISEMSGLPAGFCTAGALLALFPFVLLSMLEANSPWLPCSLPVWRSLGTVCWAWALFYLESTVLLLAAGWLAVQICRSAAVAAALMVPPLGVAVGMIYFRLLGRLAWCCADRRQEDRGA